MFVVMMFVHETPSYLYSVKKWDELHEYFDTIAAINQGNKLEMKFDKEAEEKGKNVENVKVSLKGLLCDDRTRLRNLLLMVLNWCVCSFCFYVLGFFVKYFKGSMYTNGTMMGLADLIAAIIVRISQSFTSTKTGFILAYSWVF